MYNENIKTIQKEIVMKKFLSFIFALLVLVPCTYFLTACGEKDQEKVMNISLNPSLEFVLDKNDKVVTVNALNEDGNYLLSLKVEEETVMEAFRGMTAEEAAELFLTLTKDNGFLITGNEETLTISISGNEKDLLNSVKNTANKYLQEKGVDLSKLTLKVEELEKSELVSKVKECMQEYSNKELEKMSEEELVALIKQSRKETEDLLTQELKEIYYYYRTTMADKVELNALIEKITESATGDLATFKTKVEDLMTKANALTAELNKFIGEEYQKAVDAYVKAKKALLDKRIELYADGEFSEEDMQTLDKLESALEGVEKTMNDAKDAIDNAITIAQGTMSAAMTAAKNLVSGVKAALTMLGQDLSDVNTAVTNAKNNLVENFKDIYEEYNKAYWNSVTTPITPEA